ncbi:MAG: NAD(P)-dependent oxidoreductase [Blastocatellia bacterium]
MTNDDRACRSQLSRRAMLAMMGTGASVAAFAAQPAFAQEAAADDVQKLLQRELQRSRPDYVAYVPKHWDGSANDSHNEHFLVFEGKGRTLMAVWTQSSGLPGLPPNNRIMFSRSEDDGVKWAPPTRLVGPADQKDPALIASWAFPMVSKRGRIGREVAKRARAFGLKVHAVRARLEAATNGAHSDGSDKPDWLGGPSQLQELVAASDYLVVSCPLNDQTRGLLDRRSLAWMKPSGRLINVARAEVIEEQALYDVLKERRIAGAALDVWYRYPENGDQRLLPAALPFHELDNVLMTPHLSAWTDAMIERRWRKIAANLDALAEGNLLQNIVAQK